MQAMPSPAAVANRRLLLSFLLAFAVASFLYVSISRQSGPRSPTPIAYAEEPIHQVTVDADTLKGGAIMPKLGNETLKAELGRASWKLFHTTMARFPDKPTDDEQTALSSYIHLFARLYPCGECAGHFRQILTKFPPQVRSRSAAAAWACHVHNEVNKDLKKPLFDCSNIGDFYDCGCADDAAPTSTGLARPTSKAALKGEGAPELKLEKEGEMLGG